MPVTEIHEEKNTFTIDVNLPGHDPRVTSPLFRKSRLHLIEREGGRCWVCGCTAEETGHPLEAHHLIERSFAEMIDWDIVKEYALSGEFGFTQSQRDAAKAFDWGNFDAANPYTFVDDMTVNGVLLGKDHHILADEGIHTLPFPVFFAQKFGREGYVFSKVEIVHHHQVEQNK